MRTTIDIADDLMMRTKMEAARRKTSVKALVEDALRHFFLRPRESGKKKFKFNFPVIEGTSPPAVDVSDRNALYEFFDKSP